MSKIEERINEIQAVKTDSENIVPELQQIEEEFGTMIENCEEMGATALAGRIQVAVDKLDDAKQELAEFISTLEELITATQAASED